MDEKFCAGTCRESLLNECDEIHSVMMLTETKFEVLKKNVREADE